VGMKRLSFQPLKSGGFILCGGKNVIEAIPVLCSAGVAYVKIFGSTGGDVRYPFIKQSDISQAKAVLRLNGFEVEE